MLVSQILARMVVAVESMTVNVGQIATDIDGMTTFIVGTEQKMKMGVSSLLITYLGTSGKDSMIGSLLAGSGKLLANVGKLALPLKALFIR